MLNDVTLHKNKEEIMYKMKSRGMCAHRKRLYAHRKRCLF